MMCTPPHPRSKWLVTTDWLAANLGAPDLVVLDGSYYLPAMKRDADAEYLAGHIPGALRFDIDEIADHVTDLPHMLPTRGGIRRGRRPARHRRDATPSSPMTASACSPRRGCGSRSACSARKNVFVLDGGLPKWKAEGRPVEAGTATRPANTLHGAQARRRRARISPACAAPSPTGSAQVVDARPADRFRGEAPEPRPGLRSGHMPGSRNVPSTAVVENGLLLPQDRLRAAFAAGGVDLDKPVITSCGSGVSAAILWLALDALGKDTAGALRRLLGGMGRAIRRAGRDRAGLSGVFSQP